VFLNLMIYLRDLSHHPQYAEAIQFEPFEPFFYSMDDPTHAEQMHLIRVSRNGKAPTE